MRYGHHEWGPRGGRFDEHSCAPAWGGRRGRGSRHGDGFMGGGGFGRGRGGRGLFDGAELRLVLLKLIADEPRHGYDLIRAVDGLSGGNYAPSPGVVYPALAMLEDTGDIEHVETAGARKSFAVTAQGRAELSIEKEKVEELFARLKSLSEARSDADIAPLRRAMDNLRTALRERMNRDGTNKETAYAAAAILDEAAQRIERL